MACGNYAAWRYAHIAVACLQNFALGGVFFGWASIAGSMLVSDDGGPGLTSDYVHTMFVCASTVNFMAPLLLGVPLDLLGPKVASALSIICIALGCLLFGLGVFIPGMCLLAFGGPGVQNAIIHVSNLFPHCKATATSIITGSFQLSFAVFLVFERLWWIKGYTYRELFIGYTGVCLAMLAVSLVLWPNKPYSFHEQLHEVAKERTERRQRFMSADERALDTASAAEEEADEEEVERELGALRLPSRFIRSSSKPGRKKGGGEEARRLTPAVEAPSVPDAEQNALKEGTLVEQLTSGPFIRLTLYFIVAAFWANFYVGTVATQLGDTSGLSRAEVLDYTNLFTVIMTLGVLVIPVIGLVMDRLGFVPTSLAITLCGVLFSAGTVMQQDESYILPTFVFYSLFRTMLFTFFFAYIADTLGFKYFGVLAGLVFALAGVAGVLQSPLNKWAAGTCHLQDANENCDGGRWFAVSLIQTASLAVLVGFTVLDLRQKHSHPVPRKRTVSEVAPAPLPPRQPGPYGATAPKGRGGYETVPSINI